MTLRKLMRGTQVLAESRALGIPGVGVVLEAPEFRVARGLGRGWSGWSSYDMGAGAFSMGARRGGTHVQLAANGASLDQVGLAGRYRRSVGEHATAHVAAKVGVLGPELTVGARRVVGASAKDPLAPGTAGDDLDAEADEADDEEQTRPGLTVVAFGFRVSLTVSGIVCVPQWEQQGQSLAMPLLITPTLTVAGAAASVLVPSALFVAINTLIVGCVRFLSLSCTRVLPLTPLSPPLSPVPLPTQAI